MWATTMGCTELHLGAVDVHASDDNPYSGTLFHTLKYTPVYPGKAFADLDAAQQKAERFVSGYHTEHRHSATHLVNPAPCR